MIPNNEDTLRDLVQQGQAVSLLMEDIPGDVLFVGHINFDGKGPTDERTVGIIRAAKAIAADGLNFDGGTKVSRRDVAYLLHYIFDMQEI